MTYDEFSAKLEQLITDTTAPITLVISNVIKQAVFRPPFVSVGKKVWLG